MVRVSSIFSECGNPKRERGRKRDRGMKRERESTEENVLGTGLWGIYFGLWTRWLVNAQIQNRNEIHNEQ